MKNIRINQNALRLTLENSGIPNSYTNTYAIRQTALQRCKSWGNKWFWKRARMRKDLQDEDGHSWSLTQGWENAATWLVWTEDTASTVVGFWLRKA